MATPDHPPAILLMGPTASGKTAVAVRLAEELGCEIVSVDSGQVYRHMDIGTAKPDRTTLARAPHHLIDLVGVDRVVLGSDHPADMSLERPVDFVESIPDLSRSDRELILGGNAKRLLRLA